MPRSNVIVQSKVAGNSSRNDWSAVQIAACWPVIPTTGTPGLEAKFVRCQSRRLFEPESPRGPCIKFEHKSAYAGSGPGVRYSSRPHPPSDLAVYSRERNALGNLSVPIGRAPAFSISGWNYTRKFFRWEGGKVGRGVHCNDVITIMSLGWPTE